VGVLSLNFQDKTLACRDCNASFTFTASEQEFFSLKGLVNEPRRCAHCRIVTRAARQGKPVEHLLVIACDECGAETTVTFKPTGRKPVLCLHCLHKDRERPEAEQVPVQAV
jgi:CxxC-x17-CxxC domain-containing protein